MVILDAINKRSMKRTRPYWTSSVRQVVVPTNNGSNNYSNSSDSYGIINDTIDTVDTIIQAVVGVPS